MTFSLHGLLTRAADRAPTAPALRFAGETLTYAELAARANAIAGLLVELGVRRGDRVGLWMNRSFDSVAAIFAISQAGAAYVPFEGRAPEARLAAIVDDCELRHLIVDEGHHAALASLLTHTSRLEHVLGGGAGASYQAHPWSAVAPSAWPRQVEVPVIEQDPSVLFFTSGSTGRPKGVAHDHRSMLSNVAWAVETFAPTAADRFAHVTSHHFDLSWFELFVSVAVGATLVLVPERAVQFPGELATLMVDERVSFWCSVPSVLIGLVQHGDLPGRDLAALRRVHFAGERFPTKHLRTMMLQVPGPRYCNMYGTTETHIAAYLELEAPPADDEPLPIGRRCSHVDLMAIDGQGRPAGVGETGELVIRGPSMMEGYWRLPERTAAAIVELPVSAALGGRWYRSGDLVEHLPGGIFRIIGRGDRRVKVRGGLVDLDEVEKVLLTYPGVVEVAAYAEVDADEATHITAAVRLAAEATASAAALRLHVSQALPTYAVPEQVEVLAEFPRTGSGKVSRRDLAPVVEALRRSRREQALQRVASPRDAIHRFLVDELLEGREDPGDEGSLIESGRVDSMGVAALVSFLEARFGVEIRNDDFVAENFESVGAMVRLVSRLLEPAERR